MCVSDLTDGKENHAPFVDDLGEKVIAVDLWSFVV